MPCWEEIGHSHPHEPPNRIGQLGVVSMQHHRAELFLEVNGLGRRTLNFSKQPCVRDPGYAMKLHPAVTHYMSLGI